MVHPLRLAVMLLALAPTTALAARCPNLLVVFDVSGSMQGTVAGTTPTQNRYQVGRDAVKSLLSGNTANFRYGLELFGTAANNFCGVSSCYYPATGCESVLCDYSTTAPISAVLDARSYEGSTPTATAINTAMTRADMQDSTRSRYIILLTDGDPNCTSNTIGDTENALNAARTANVKTYVLGFAGGTAANLNRMAIAGGTNRVAPASCNATTNKCYYDAANASELNIALAAIVSAVGGELGGGACDDSCYGGGCTSAQICKASACVANPCAQMSCPSGVCVEGQCKAPCDPACFNNQYCDNGVCREEAACATACTARNQTCVNGQCVEDYCSHPTHAIVCSGGGICIKNSCQVFSGGTGGGAGADAGGGGGTGSGGGGGSTNTTAGSGCCAGAPGATSLFGLLLGGSFLAAMRRRVRRG